MRSLLVPVLLVLLASPALAADVVTVPDVVGETEDAALEALEALGLEARVIEVAGPSIGEVATQAPEAGAKVERGATVTIRVGIRARIETVVPDVAGQPVEDALALLAGAYDVTVEPVHGTEHRVGTVIESEPAAGATLWYRGQLTLRVAAGERGVDTTPDEPEELPPFLPRVVVPSFVGKTPKAAQSSVENTGLRVEVRTKRCGDGEAGLIVDQDPRPGAERPSGSVVVVFVPAEGQVPSITGYVQMDAIRALGRAGFGSRFDARPTGRLDARVVEQRPAGGARAVFGSLVVLRFDDGKKEGGSIWNAKPEPFVEVPAVVGVSGARAQAMLETAGFVAELAAEADLDATIEWQGQQPNARIRKGAKIAIGIGPEPVEPAAADLPTGGSEPRPFRRAAGIRKKPLDDRLKDRR